MRMLFWAFSAFVRTFGPKKTRGWPTALDDAVLHLELCLDRPDESDITICPKILTPGARTLMPTCETMKIPERESYPFPVTADRWTPPERFTKPPSFLLCPVFDFSPPALFF